MIRALWHGALVCWK